MIFFTKKDNSQQLVPNISKNKKIHVGEQNITQYSITLNLWLFTKTFQFIFYSG